MLCIAVDEHSFSCWQYLCTVGYLNSDLVVASILILFSDAGVVGVVASVEAFSEAWRPLQCVG